MGCASAAPVAVDQAAGLFVGRGSWAAVGVTALSAGPLVPYAGPEAALAGGDVPVRRAVVKVGP